MVGAFQMSSCSPAICPSDRPVPTTPITTLSATYTVQTNISLTGLRYLVSSANTGSLKACKYNSYGYGFRETGYGFTNEASIQTNDVATGTATWTYSGVSQVSGGGGVYRRLSDGVELATGIAWVANKYTFSSATKSGSYLNPSIEYRQFLLSGVNCCTPPSSYETVMYVTTGGATSTTPYVPTNLYMQWQACSSTTIGGLEVQLLSAGLSLAPWTISVGGGAVRVTDKNGSTNSYTGPLTSIASAISATGNFSVSVTGGVTLVGGVSNATASDLVDTTSLPLTRLSCSTILYLAMPGALLAPSSTGSYVAGFVFNPALGYTDDKAGFESFVRATKYPTTDYFVSGGLYFHAYNSFDGLLSDLSFSSYRITPGLSVHTQDVTVFAATSTVYNLSDVYYCGTVTTGCYPGPGGFGPEWCNSSFPAGPLDCDGNLIITCSYMTCICIHEEQNVTDLPERTVTAVQTLTGGFTVS